jgi:uncharacterized membrane-anchored protein YitT (DUF2179 family)
MIPKSCRLFGQDHATEQMLSGSEVLERGDQRPRDRLAASVAGGMVMGLVLGLVLRHGQQKSRRGKIRPSARREFQFQELR